MKHIFNNITHTKDNFITRTSKKNNYQMLESNPFIAYLEVT